MADDYGPGYRGLGGATPDQMDRDRADHVRRMKRLRKLREQGKYQRLPYYGALPGDIPRKT